MSICNRSHIYVGIPSLFFLIWQGVSGKVFSQIDSSMRLVISILAFQQLRKDFAVYTCPVLR